MRGTENFILQCRTAKRRAEELSYDPECVDDIEITYDEYVFKYSRTTPMIRFPQTGPPDVDVPVPSMGRDVVPRRLCIKPADESKHRFIQGCDRCTWAQNQHGPRRLHTEACRSRLEEEMVKHQSDTRLNIAQERHYHCAAAQVAAGDE